ncbi:MAG: hypothetical protein HYY93_11415 [Planctomycetes bacterium]|nr:hypothetical protein [Planctomycetota bacterium]
MHQLRRRLIETAPEYSDRDTVAVDLLERIVFRLEHCATDEEEVLAWEMEHEEPESLRALLAVAAGLVKSPLLKRALADRISDETSELVLEALIRSSQVLPFASPVIREAATSWEEGEKEFRRGTIRELLFTLLYQRRPDQLPGDKPDWGLSKRFGGFDLPHLSLSSGHAVVDATLRAAFLARFESPATRNTKIKMLLVAYLPGQEPDVAQSLVKVLSNEKDPLRSSALIGWPVAPRRELLDVLLARARHDPDATVRARVVRYLSFSDTPSGLLNTLESLWRTDESPEVLGALASELGIHLSSTGCHDPERVLETGLRWYHSTNCEEARVQIIAALANGLAPRGEEQAPRVNWPPHFLDSYSGEPSKRLRSVIIWALPMAGVDVAEPGLSRLGALETDPELRRQIAEQLEVVRAAKLRAASTSQGK